MRVNLGEAIGRFASAASFNEMSTSTTNECSHLNTSGRSLIGSVLIN